MSVAVVTGSAGLIGSEAAKFLDSQGMDVVGIDNNLRGYFFGPEASTEWKVNELRKTLKSYRHFSIDIRDHDAIAKVFQEFGSDIQLVVHTAAQPSHDWAAREPQSARAATSLPPPTSP